MTEAEKLERRTVYHKEYMERYKYLCDLSSETTKLYHNVLMTINAGSFGLSFTYLLQMKEYIKESPVWLIIISWICMGFSLITTLFTQLNGLSLLDDDIELCGLEFENKVDDITPEDDNKRKILEKKILNGVKVNKLFEFVQGLVTAIGIVLLLVYAGITILDSKILSDKVNKSVTNETSLKQTTLIDSTINNINKSNKVIHVVNTNTKETFSKQITTSDSTIHQKNKILDDKKKNNKAPTQKDAKNNKQSQKGD